MSLRAIETKTVHKPGTRVTIGDDLPAMVSAVQIGANDAVRYLIVWWDGRVRREDWVDPSELSETDLDRLRIGFIGRA